MAKSKFKNKNLAFALISLVAIGTLIIKAFVRLPLSNTSVSANGLYFHLNEAQFIETFIVTLLVVGFFSIKVIKTTTPNSCIFAIGFALLNLGLMIFDARLQKHNVFVEAYIRQYYGGTAFVLFLGLLAFVIGILIINYGRKKM